MSAFRSVINSLQEFDMIAGSSQTLEFEIFDENGEDLDLTDATTTWAMGHFGNPEMSVFPPLTGEVFDVNKFRVNLLPEHTKYLSGTFVHQPIILGGGGMEFRPSQGIINIIPQIGIDI